MVESKLAIISEIYGLSVPCSMKINYDSRQFYLYPKHYSSHLKRIKEILELSEEKIPFINYNVSSWCRTNHQ